MFCKLAVKNALRSYRDYGVYFLTLALGVCLFYTFNALDQQPVMLMLGQSKHYMVETIMVIVGVLSAFVAAVLVCLILYANTFLMKRRKKELGTYLLLGLPTGWVSLLMALETGLMGLFALVGGLGLGVLASQGLSLLSVAMFQVSPEALTFVFSWAAVVKTVAAFGGVFLVVMACTGLSVSRAKLLDLMRGERKNEELRERPLWVSALLFLAGVVLLIVAYAMLLTRGFVIDPGFYLMLALGTLGTLLFFRSLSGFLLRWVRGKKLYYRGLNMFVLRQFNARIHSNYLSMTVICLLLLLAMGITACSVGLNNTIEQSTAGQAPYDLTVMNYSYRGDGTDPVVEALLRAGGVEPAEVFSGSHTCVLYYNEPEVTGISQEDAYAVMARSDANALLALQGEPPMEGDAPTLARTPLFNTFGEGVAVVPDQVAQGLPIRRQLVSAQYRGEKERTEAAVKAVLEDGAADPDHSLMAFSRLDFYWENMGSKILVLYLGLYMGILFLVTAAAVLALQQLSQAADNAPRYRVLARLGVEKSMRDRSVLWQVLLAFCLPLGLALVHAVVGMTAANALIAQVGRVDAAASSFVTAGLILLVYGAYFAATYFGSRRAAGQN